MAKKFLTCQYCRGFGGVSNNACPKCKGDGFIEAMPKRFILDEREVYSELWRAANPSAETLRFASDDDLLDHCKRQADKMGCTIQDYLSHHCNFVFEE